MPALPSGTILMWSGSVASIPGGFVLCDGTLGTPDLRDRFVVGAGFHFDPGDTGGGVEHNHPYTGDGHQHTIPAGGGITLGTDRSTTTTETSDNGTTDITSHLPPYYALAFIMKT